MHDSRSIAFTPASKAMTAFLCLAFASLVVMLTNTTINQDVFLSMNAGLNSIGSASFWAAMTNLGDGHFALAIVAILFADKPERIKVVLVSSLMTLLITHAMKAGFSVGRPPLVLPHDTFEIIGRAYRRGSFPSGHTATAFLLAGILCLYYRGTAARTLIIATAVLAGISRVAVGVHWPLDVLAGAALGFMPAFVGSYLCNRKEPRQVSPLKQDIYKVATAAICLAFAVSLVFRNTGFNDYTSVVVSQGILAAVSVAVSVYRLGQAVKPLAFRLLQWLMIHHREKMDMLSRFIRFGMVGASGFVVDVSIFTLLTSIGIPHVTGRVGAYWVSASWNWMMNRRFTFSAASKEEKARQWLKYLGMCAVSFVPSTGTYYLLTSYFALFAEYKQLALLAGVAVGMLFNFTGASVLIFKPAEEQ